MSRLSNDLTLAVKSALVCMAMPMSHRDSHIDPRQYTRGMSSLQPWIEKIPSSWIPDDRGIYISTRGLVVGYGLSSDDLQRIAKSNEAALSSTVLQYNTSLYASHELIERYQEHSRVFEVLRENPFLTDILERFTEGNYTISIGCNPVSSLEITLTNTPRR